MTLRLGGSGRTTSPAIASLSIVAALACGITAVGCSSSSGGGGGTTSTADAGSDTGTTVPDAQADQTVLGQCTTPTFAPATGATLAAGATVTVTATGLPANGFIYYTTDGTLPTHGSTVVTSGGTITVNTTETIHAIAYATGACSDSAVATASYTVPVSEAGLPEAAVLPACGAPTFVPNGGTVTIGSSVTIDPPTGFPTNFPAGNAFIYYTLNGTVPTHASAAYSGPIQVNSTESIRAIAYYPGVCGDSAVTLANFTPIAPDGGVLVAPQFNPTAQTGNNDFLVSLTEAGNPAATICFTLGAGTTAPTPTCTVTATTATCSGTSQMYNAGAGLGAAGSVTINGGVTDANGNVTVSAIACAPGNATTAPIPQTYKLQVAAPTMQGPASSPTPLPWLTAGYNPTMASATVGSSLRYNSFTSGAAPALSCTTGTALAANPGALPVTQNITYEGVACKPGYAPSAVATFPYAIVLDPPAFVDATKPSVTEGTGTYDRALTVAFVGDTITAGTPSLAPGEYVCYTTNGTAPACGGTAGTCATGSTMSVANLSGAAGPLTTGTVPISTSATVVEAIACSPSLNTSTVASATYTLQLDPPALDSTTGPGPGCANTSGTPGACVVGTAGAGLPVLSFSIPASLVGSFTPDVEETIGSPPPSGGAQVPYQFVCAMKGGTPACSATGCSAGTIVTGSTFQTANSVSLGSIVAAEDSWSLIGCPGTAAASVGFTPSTVTTVVFSGPGAAVAPSISPASNTFSNLVVPTLTNQGTAAETICYTTDGTTPTCTAGVCGNATTGTTTTLPLGTGTTTVATVTVTAGGSGYTSVPSVIIAPPTGGAGAQQASATATLGYSVASIAITAGGTGCGPNPTVAITGPGGTGTAATATATVDSTGTITGITLTNVGSGYTAAPTVTIGGCATAPTTAAATLAAAGSVLSVAVTTPGIGYNSIPAVSFSGGGGAGATATAALDSLQVTAVNVTAGGAGYGSPPTVTIAAPTAGTTAQATATLGFGVASIAVPVFPFCVSNTPTVTIAAPSGGGTTATATVTVMGAAPSTITGFTITNPGSGYTSPPIATINGCGFAESSTSTLLGTGSVIAVNVTGPGSNYATAPAVSFSGGGGAGAAATATVAMAYAGGGLPFAQLSPAQVDDTVVSALGCTAGAASSPVVSQTYHFTLATPTVVDVTQTTATKATVNVANGATFTVGDTIQFGLLSNFTDGAPSICYSTDGSTPACPCVPSMYVSSAPLVAGTGPYAGGWQTAQIPTSLTTFPTTSNTLNAIACNTTGTQVASALYTASLALKPQTPVADNPGGTYFSPPQVSFSSTTGATICYTTVPGATPACTAGACTNGSSTFAAPIPVTTTGTVLQAIACTPTLTSAPSAVNTYALTVAPIILAQSAAQAPSNPANPDTVCQAAPSIAIGFDCATFPNGNAACSTATHSALGPTHAATDAFICYSTDGTAVTSCAMPPATGITCFDTGPNGTVTQTIPLNSTTTIQALGCLSAFDNSSANRTVNYAPYTDVAGTTANPGSAITLDGVLTDWQQANEGVAATSGGSEGYFTYSSASGSLYFAVAGDGGPLSSTYVGIYIGDGVATGAATAGLPNLGAQAISPNAGIRYAFEWPTDNSAAPIVYAWTAAGWGSPVAITVSVGVPATLGSTVEFGVPLSSLPNLVSLTTNPVTVIESVVTGFATASPPTAFTFPGGTTATATGGVAYANWFNDLLGSCLTPNQQIQ
jgi:hypothetical protein